MKRQLVADPTVDMDTYIAGKSRVLQDSLVASGEFTAEELAAIHLDEAGVG